MISRLHLSAILIIAAAVSGIVLLVSGVAVKVEWLTSISATVTIMSLLLLIFERWMWRWRLLHGWFVKMPDLNGTWQVDLKSNWNNPETGRLIPVKIAYLSICQTYFNLSVRLMTDESISELVGSSIQHKKDGTYQVTGVYLSNPQINVRDRSPIHYGAFVLDVQGNPPIGLLGHYWTDRNSAGDIVGERRLKETCSSFIEAENLFTKKYSNFVQDEGMGLTPKAIKDLTPPPTTALEQ